MDADDQTGSPAPPTDPEAARVASLYRYPVKGLTPERLETVALTPGEALPFDRAYAIEAGSGKFDPLAPDYLPKINFLMLMRDEKLAAIDTRFDETDRTLTISRDGRQVVRGALDTPIGRSMIEQFIAGYLGSDLRGAPKVVQAPGHTFADVPAKCVHIVNLASVAALERVADKPIDPLRFRANIYIAGLEPWAEFTWLDKSITLGNATLNVWSRTQRCAATNVDPATGARDMALPGLLQRTFGHEDFGIYASVRSGATIAEGATVSVAT
ncbi:MAG: MOSC N-terminal beta barrel domain-containing protein [Pseudomonadota bacterium]